MIRRPRSHIKMNRRLIYSMAIISLVVVTVLSVTIHMITKSDQKVEEDLLAVSLTATNKADNETIEEDVVNTENVENNQTSENSEIPAELLQSNKTVMSFDVKIDGTMVPEEIDYYRVFIDEFEKIKAGDKDTIVKYFGNSDVFLPEVVADRMMATEITFLSYSEDKNGDREINIHVCTVDYQKMNNDFTSAKDNSVSNGATETDATELAKRTVAENLINNEYKVCYNIPVIVHDGEIVPKEYLKQALTGGWYTGIGIELEPVKCIN